MSTLPLIPSNQSSISSTNSNINTININSNININAKNANGDITLGQYLVSLEEKSIENVSEFAFASVPIYYLFSICGGLHIPYGLPGYEFVNIWKVFLYITTIIFVISTIAIAIYDYAMGGFASIIFILSFLFQAFIVYPVTINTYKRINMPITKNQMEVLPETIKICQYYVLLTTILSLGYYFIILYTTISHQEYSSDHIHYPVWFMITAIYTGLSPLAVALLSMWGLFFIVFDAKVMYLNIIDLQELAVADQLTMINYTDVYHQYIELNRDSQELCDGIAIVAYISIVLFVISCWIFATEFLQYTLVFISVEVTLQFREAFLILFALPSIAKANEKFDEFSSLMSMLEWGQGDYSLNGDIGGTNNNMDIEAPSVMSEESRLIDRHNMVNMRIWAATVDRPLIMYILGRKIKKREMRVQLFAVLVVGLGSLASFAISGAYRSLND